MDITQMILALTFTASVELMACLASQILFIRITGPL